MSRAKTAPIKEFAIGIYDGPHATPPEASEGPVFLGIKNVTPEGRLDFTDVRYVSEEDFPRWTRRVSPQKDDIVFSYEATLHRYALIPEGFRGCLGRRMALIRPDTSKVQPRYLHYYLLGAAWRAVVEANVISGATVDRIPIAKFPDFSVTLPSLEMQETIVEALSAYDDLIENNRRRIDLVKRAAGMLYDDWFLRLRFPGHEHVRVLNGVPEGWERKTLSSLCESIDYGYTASGESEAVGPKFLRITDIVDDFIDWPSVPYCRIEDDKISKFSLREGDIVVARTGATVGYAKRIHRRNPEAVFASYLVRLRVKPNVESLMVGIFVESEDYKRYVRSRVGGAAQPNANAKVLAGAEILVPAGSIQEVFRDVVEPLIDIRETLELQNERLRQSRDLLLPRLMNGTITV